MKLSECQVEPPREGGEFIPTWARSKQPDLCSVLLLAIFLTCFVGSIFAVDPTSHISQYGHSVWRVQDGYFGGAPFAITQTTDGYIWVGTNNGLFEFDGVRFVGWNAQSGQGLPSSFIFSLLGARDGSLWIGTSEGLAHLVNGHLNIYEKGSPVGPIMEDKDGKIWFGRNRSGDQTVPLCQVLEVDVHCFGIKDGLDISIAAGLAQDASGYLWVGSSKTLARWRPDASAHSKVYRPPLLQTSVVYAGVGAVAQAADGSLWVGIDVPGPGGGLQHLIDDTLKPFRAPNLNGETLLVDRLWIDHQENLWVGTENRGLYKIRGADVDHYGGGEGLSGDSVLAIFEDREGDVWVATSDGLDMFRDFRVKSISAREGLAHGVDSVAAGPDGRVWIGTASVQVLQPESLSLETIEALKGDQITSLLIDHAGRPWAGMNNKLFVREQGKFREIKKNDDGALGMITGIAEDSDNNIWVETREPGTLVRIHDFKVQEMYAAPGTPLARKIVADPQSGLWLGLATGDLARFRDGQAQTFTFGEHPASRVMTITAASDGSILGGTAFGVVAWKDGKQQILSVLNGLPCNNVSGLISDNAGNLWLFAQCGLIEIQREQMQLWWEHAESKLTLRVFDNFDGFRPGLGHFNNSAKTPDGRLWFANGDLLQVVDPAHLSKNTLPPAVQISAVVADHKAYPVDSAIQIPPLTRDLEVDYTALSYAVPQKVLFRYKLEGRDARFQEAGTRRQAFYNDLRPGRYRFRVLACNNDGVWNEEGASLDFSVLPAFYQTNWFLLLCGTAAAVLAWAAYRWRIRQVSARLDSQFQGRLAERTRIAQELHDTLLQGFMSASMQLSVANRQLPADLPAKVIVTDVLEQIKNVIEEGRNAIRGMRLPSASSDDLEQAFLRIPQDLAVKEHTNFKVIVEGQSRPLHPLIRDEVYRIGKEAVANAFRHSHASAIEVEIEYVANQLRLVIRDNGCGIDPDTLKSGREGHWGLSGMRERARVIGARFKIWSNSAGGTEVELVVPGQVAYCATSGDAPSRWLPRVFRKGVRSDSENKVSQ